MSWDQLTASRSRVACSHDKGKDTGVGMIFSPLLASHLPNKSHGPKMEWVGALPLPGKGCGDRKGKELGPWTPYLLHLHSPKNSALCKSHPSLPPASISGRVKCSSWCFTNAYNLGSFSCCGIPSRLSPACKFSCRWEFTWPPAITLYGNTNTWANVLFPKLFKLTNFSVFYQKRGEYYPILFLVSENHSWN